MATVRKELVWATMNKAYSLLDYNVQNNYEKQNEFMKKTVFSDKSLTNDEKSEAIILLNKHNDYTKVNNNKGIKRICENCQDECLAILYCEHCVRSYLKSGFSNWTSGNNDIDNLIRKCQIETIRPDRINEWIPYNNLQNIKYLTRGGFSEIYTADWIDGSYTEWDSKEKQLKRFGRQLVVLKRLENVESANRSWLEEGKSHMSISNKNGNVVQCFGLTKDPSDGSYMLVMNRMGTNLRNYLQLQHNELTWNVRTQIAYDIVFPLLKIHNDKAIHRDLHSGNILFGQTTQRFGISDLGFCGPADKPLNSVYGNLPYIAPEVISGKQTTFASDIYSIGMLMWEISSGEPPFSSFDHDYDLAMNIINGMRPKMVPGTPLIYFKLMEKCWDANPTKRPDIYNLCSILHYINRSYFQNKEQINYNLNNLQLNRNFNVDSSSINSLIRNFNSKLYNFENFSEPRDATKAYHSKQNDLSIPDNILFKNRIDERSNSIDNEEVVVKGKSKRARPSNSDGEKDTNKSNKVRNSDNKVLIQSTYNNNDIEFRYYVQRNYEISDDDDDEAYNNPNFHLKDQDELEIPEDMF